MKSYASNSQRVITEPYTNQKDMEYFEDWRWLLNALHWDGGVSHAFAQVWPQWFFLGLSFVRFICGDTVTVWPESNHPSILQMDYVKVMHVVLADWQMHSLDMEGLENTYRRQTGQRGLKSMTEKKANINRPPMHSRR